MARAAGFEQLDDGFVRSPLVQRLIGATSIELRDDARAVGMPSDLARSARVGQFAMSARPPALPAPPCSINLRGDAKARGLRYMAFPTRAVAAGQNALVSALPQKARPSLRYVLTLPVDVSRTVIVTSKSVRPP